MTKICTKIIISLFLAASFIGCDGGLDIVINREEIEDDTRPGDEQQQEEDTPPSPPVVRVEHHASLSFGEFGENPGKYAAGYKNPTAFSNEAGVWEICAYNNTTSMQINNNKVSYIGTPLFEDAIITEISLSFAESFSGNIYFCGKNGNTSAEDIRVTAPCKSLKDVTADVSGAGLGKIYLRSSACARIVSISLTYVTGGTGTETGGDPGTGSEGGSGTQTGGEGGDVQKDTIAAGYGVGFSSLYEVPRVKTALQEGQAYSKSIVEFSDDRKAFVCNMPTDDQLLVTHTYVYSGKMYRNYTMLFDENHGAALWVAYPLHRTAYPDNDVGRASWTYDPAIPKGWQTAGCDGSYHKGHQVPSNDRQTSKSANKQTFYYSNQTPQWQTRFNDGVWNSLELNVNGAAPSGSDTLYVVTGPLYESSATITDETGKTVPRPSGYFKCIMKCSFSSSGTITAAKGAGYIFPKNAEYSGTGFSSYATPIDEVEERTGFDFFANVPASIQAQAESKIMLSL